MAAQLPAKLDEERFQRQRRTEVELLEGAPGLANELAGALGTGEALGRAVLGEELAPVGVDGGALRSDRHDDEVAVPGCELFQRREQLFPFGAAGCPADSLLGFAGREVEQLEALLGFQFRIGATLFRAVEDALRGLTGLELRLRVDGACNFEQGLAPTCAVRIQEACGAVEPTGREPRQRGGLVRLEPRRARV